MTVRNHKPLRRSSSGEDRDVGHRRGDRLVGELEVDHLAGEERLVHRQVEVAMAAEGGEDDLGSPASLHASASRIAAAMAWVGSGAGTIPSARANWKAAVKHSVCGSRPLRARPAS